MSRWSTRSPQSGRCGTASAAGSWVVEVHWTPRSAARSAIASANPPSGAGRRGGRTARAGTGEGGARGRADFPGRQLRWRWPGRERPGSQSAARGTSQLRLRPTRPGGRGRSRLRPGIRAWGWASPHRPTTGRRHIGSACRRMRGSARAGPRARVTGPRPGAGGAASTRVSRGRAREETRTGSRTRRGRVGAGSADSDLVSRVSVPGTMLGGSCPPTRNRDYDGG